ncbi:MAG TPA: hypothetical protein VIB49_04950 [Thermoplasmata archaeon]|jgi:hypothetical protein
MVRQGVAHEHGSLKFRVRREGESDARFEPDIVARRGSILFLLKAVDIDSRETGSLDIMPSFLAQHSEEIVLIVIAPPRDIDRIDPDAYDEVYASSDLASAVARIKGQDPHGIIRPFAKPRRP